MRQKVFSLPTVGAPSASDSPSALSVQAWYGLDCMGPCQILLSGFFLLGGYLHPPYPFTEHHLVAFDALPYTLIKPLVKKYTIRGGGSNALYTAYTVKPVYTVYTIQSA